MFSNEQSVISTACYWHDEEADSSSLCNHANVQEPFLTRAFPNFIHKKTAPIWTKKNRQRRDVYVQELKILGCLFMQSKMEKNKSN